MVPHDDPVCLYPIKTTWTCNGVDTDTETCADPSDSDRANLVLHEAEVVLEIVTAGQSACVDSLCTTWPGLPEPCCTGRNPGEAFDAFIRRHRTTILTCAVQYPIDYS